MKFKRNAPEGPGRERERRVLQVHPDAAIAQIAARQLGLVTRAQMLAAGLSGAAIAHRLATWRLHRVHRGVYAVGHPALVPLARELAAVLACGKGAVLSHRSAAQLWELVPAAGGDVEVTVARNGGRRPGIRAHRCRLEARDVRCRMGIRVTSPPRTLLDLAEVVSPRNLERAVAEAQARGLARHSELLDHTERNPGRRSVARLRGLLHEQDDRP